MGVCKHTVFSITPILTFPLAGGRNTSVRPRHRQLLRRRFHLARGFLDLFHIL